MRREARRAAPSATKASKSVTVANCVERAGRSTSAVEPLHRTRRPPASLSCFFASRSEGSMAGSTKYTEGVTSERMCAIASGPSVG